MTEAELKAIRVYGAEGTPTCYVDAYDGGRLLAEVKRLRGLVKDAQARGCNCGMDTELEGCPWCFGEPRRDSSGYVSDPGVIAHTDDCPAFTPEGDVR